MKIEIDVRTTPDENDPEGVALESYLFLIDEEDPLVFSTLHQKNIYNLPGRKQRYNRQLSYCQMTIDSICDYVESLGMNYYRQFIDDTIETFERRRKWGN